jgi:beta-lactam-binding protein with PASTA domain
VWLVVGVLVVLALCGCAGLIARSVTAGHKSGQAAPASHSTRSPATTAAVTASPSATVAKGAPNVVGMRLNDAETRLKAAGFHDIHVEDITGKNRLVLDAKHWVVRTEETSKDSGKTKVTLGVGKPTDVATTAPAQMGVVPNVVCRDLQAAQDALQHAGYYVLSSEDGTGKGRHQIIDRNWVVIAQSAAPGSTPRLSTRITLTVVKYGEPSTRCHT